jgi:hypothetical protein
LHSGCRCRFSSSYLTELPNSPSQRQFKLSVYLRSMNFP